MNNIRSYGFVIVFITNILILFKVVEVLADYIAPEVQTQINKRTDLFQKSVNDLPSLEKSLEGKNQASINAMGDGSTSMPEGLSSITQKSKGELESESGKLEAIHEHDLNTRGREEMIRNNTINELYRDYSRSLEKQHMEDAKVISEAQNKLLANLFAKLKELTNTDCKTIKGDKKHEPEYFLKVITSEHKDTVYNQKYCEEPRRIYDCKDQLVLRCLSFSHKPVGFQITGSNIPYKAIPRGDFTSYEFSNRATAGGSIRTGGGSRGFLGLVNKGSTTTYQSSTVTINFSFNITAPKEIVGKLEIMNLQFNTVMSVKINGRFVVVAPGGGYTLDLAGYHEDVVKGKRKFGGVCGPKVKHVTRYPLVTTGTTTHILGKISAQNYVGRIDLLPYLSDGSNYVEIKVIGLDQALASFTLNASERICLNWHKEWEEICRLR